MKYHRTITNRLAIKVTGKFVVKDMEKLEPSYIGGVVILKINLKVAQHVRMQINKWPIPSHSQEEWKQVSMQKPV